MSAEHTPGPWMASNAGFVLANGGGTTIALMFATDVPGAAEANAERIAQCVNAHDDMLAALRGAEEWLSGWASAEPYLSRIRAAIARATGAQR